MKNQRLQKLLDKQAQLAAQIKDLEARTRNQDRKNDTRRKVIAGALALEHMTKNRDSAFTKTLMPLLDEYVTRQLDRNLFNAIFQEAGMPLLEPLPPEQKAANDKRGREGAKGNFTVQAKG